MPRLRHPRSPTDEARHPPHRGHRHHRGIAPPSSRPRRQGRWPARPGSAPVTARRPPDRQAARQWPARKSRTAPPGRSAGREARQARGPVDSRGARPFPAHAPAPGTWPAAIRPMPAGVSENPASPPAQNPRQAWSPGFADSHRPGIASVAARQSHPHQSASAAAPRSRLRQAACPA